jgi:uncharacterized membrane protein YkgB
MKAEFARFQVPQYRTLTGVLEILGGLGVLIGIWVPMLGVLGSMGLALLMGLGVLARIRVQDGMLQCLPALFFCILNGVITVLHLRTFP